MWEDSNYCWVVLCKNHWFHMRQNFFFRHRIPLALTNAVEPLPSLGKRFMVRCDDCGKMYTYKPKDLRRIEQELPKSFKPHPLFVDDSAVEAPSQANRNVEPHQEEPPKRNHPKRKKSELKGPEGRPSAAAKAGRVTFTATGGSNEEPTRLTPSRIIFLHGKIHISVLFLMRNGSSLSLIMTGASRI